MPVLSNPVDDEIPPTGAASDTGAFAQKLRPLEITRASPVRLHAASLESQVDAPTSTPPPRALAPTPVPGTMRAVKLPQVPGFVVSGELGRGGMGVVYQAKQIRLNRVVALKMLLHADTADLIDVIRFRSEAEAVAAIKHPHVVQVHEFGHVDGKPYFAMEFLSGGTLHSRIRTLGKSEPLPAAQLVEKLARAVQAAHSEGIVHRDLKPGNILFDEAGEPRVTDFGLAKRFSLQLTNTQAVMGTPAYMSPEQASGRTKFVGPPSDIYSLGVILYECLTGKPPFDGVDSISVIHQVLNDLPNSIRSQVRTVPRDLELICLKCLEKDPVDRYATAESLADDLARYLAGKPVLVRPAGPIERGIKWARRRPTMATVYALTGLVCFVTILGLGFGGLWQRAEQAKIEVEQARDRLTEQNEVVEAALTGEQKASAQANATATVAKEARLQVESANQKLESLSYFSNVGAANLELRQGNVLRAQQILDTCPVERRDWEWWHAYRAANVCIGSGTTTTISTDISFGRDEFQVVTTDVVGKVTGFHSNDKKVNYWEAASEKNQQVFYKCRLSGDGNRLVTLPSQKALADNTVRVWEIPSMKEIRSIKLPPGRTSNVAISGNGERILVSFSELGKIITYEVSTGKELGSRNGEFTDAEYLGFDWNGTRAITDSDGDVVIWDVNRGETLGKYRPKSGAIRAMALNADGTKSVTGTSDDVVSFFDVATKKVVEVEKAQAGILTVAISRDGRHAASSGYDGIVCVWSVETGALVRQFRGHTRRVLSVKFDSTGERVISTDDAMRFFVWHLHPKEEAVEKLLPMDVKKRCVTIRDDGIGFSISDDGTGAFWDPAKPEESRPLTVPTGEALTTFAFAPSGKQFATGTRSGSVCLWENADAKPIEIAHFKSEIRRMIFNEDGTRLLVANMVRFAVYDLKTRKLLFEENSSLPVLAFSADGKKVAGANASFSTIWEVDSHSPQSIRKYGSDSNVTALAFSPDGATLLQGTEGWHIFQFDLRLPQSTPFQGPTRVLNGHTAGIRSLTFHPKGHRFVSGADDGTIKVWDSVSGYEAIGLTAEARDPIRSVAFIHGGTILAAIPDRSTPVLFRGSPRFLVVPPKR